MIMYQNLDDAEFCAVELDSTAELELSVSRLWLLALLHFCRAPHLAPLERLLWLSAEMLVIEHHPM